MSDGDHPQAAAPAPARAVYRHRWPTRIWHWLNLVTIVVMLMSGLMIFNAHPHLYWGRYGANPDPAWLEIGATQDRGILRIGSLRIETTGVLGRWTDPDGNVQRRAFPWWSTIPSRYNLALSRRWHLSFAWIFALGGLAYIVWTIAGGHLRRDLAPHRAELTPGHLWRDIRDHATLNFPKGEAAARYNTLQKLAYLIVLAILIPVMVLTGLSMSPGFTAAVPVMDLFGGRQSARSIHFICAWLLVAFFVVHILMVVLAGPVNEVRSMITGRYRLPPEKTRPAPEPAE